MSHPDTHEPEKTAENEHTDRHFGIMPSMEAAAKLLKVTSRTLRNWRAQECPGFYADGRVNADAVAAWAEKRRADRGGSSDAREQKLFEEIRKLRIANDAKEARLVEIAWVLQRYQLAGAAIEKVRAKSESEDPMKFASAAGDVSACREVVQAIWDGITESLQNELARPFEQAAAEATKNSATGALTENPAA